MDWFVFAQDVPTDYGQWGIAGALLTFAAGFVAYLKHRDGEDRKERAEMSNNHEATIKAVVADHRAAHDTCEQTIRAVVSDHKEAVDKLTDSFRLELADERSKRDQDRKEFRESLHILRNQTKPQ